MARSETSYYYYYTITNAITIIIDVSVVFSQLFTGSLKENTVPFTWKTSVICPVQNNNKKQKRNPCLNDYRLIAMTSTVMTCFERIILHQLMKHTKPHLDPYQFAYKHNGSTEDTHSFAQCIYSSWKTRFICPNSLHQLFFCLQYHTTSPHGKQNFETRR